MGQHRTGLDAPSTRLERGARTLHLDPAGAQRVHEPLRGAGIPLLGGEDVGVSWPRRPPRLLVTHRYIP